MSFEEKKGKESKDLQMKSGEFKLLSLPQNVIDHQTIPFLIEEINFQNDEEKLEWKRFHHGPTPHSNWVIKDKLLMSGRPYLEKIKDFVESGINVFVCLQEKKECRIFRDYKKKVRELTDSEKKVSFHHLEIEDGWYPDIVDAQKLVKEIFNEINQGNRVLVYCLGGRGRTGTMIGCFLAEYFRELSVEDILKYVQCMYDSRENKKGHCPENPHQRKFISDYFDAARKK